MKFFPRYLPAVFALMVLIGCALPISSSIPGAADKPTLLSMPGLFDQADSVMNMFGGAANFMQNPARANQLGHANATPSVLNAGSIARFLYIVPVVALLIIVINLRGLVSKSVQVIAGAVWVVVSIGVPYLAAEALLEANPTLKMLKSFASPGSNDALAFSPGIGEWLIILAALGSILSAFGILRVRPVVSEPST